MEQLSINRKHEIPTLIIVDGRTRSILTADGVGDVQHLGGKEALKHWQHLMHIIRGMESKYESHM